MKPAEHYIAEIVRLEVELDALRAKLAAAPVAIMDTRAALGLCAPREEDFPALYALQGKRVRIVMEDECD